jgi:outer membrane protein TolC
MRDMSYKGGTTTYLEVLDGQRSLYSEELTLAEARGSEYQSLVQLYLDTRRGLAMKMYFRLHCLW